MHPTPRLEEKHFHFTGYIRDRTRQFADTYTVSMAAAFGHGIPQHRSLSGMYSSGMNGETLYTLHRLGTFRKTRVMNPVGALRQSLLLIS